MANDLEKIEQGVSLAERIVAVAEGLQKLNLLGTFELIINNIFKGLKNDTTS